MGRAEAFREVGEAIGSRRRERPAYSCVSGVPSALKLTFMHLIIWEFAVREEHLEDFIRAYDANGDWAKLFRLAEGYLGTQLLRSSQNPNVFPTVDFLTIDFLTIDRWESAACFEKFQQRFATEYKKLDARFEGYTLSERKVGVFQDEPGILSP